MTLNEAFIHFINSDAFREVAKDTVTGSTYRVYKYRFDKGELSERIMKSLLLEHGYTIKQTLTVTAPKVKRK